MKRILFFLFLSLVSNQFLSAQCIEGDCEDNSGVFQFDNGNKYNGKFRHSVMNGKGVMHYANGNQFNGDWVNGFRDGTGMFIFSNGNQYNGAFRKGKFSGLGSMTFQSGNKYVGNWENDQPNGSGKFVFTNNERYEGNFKNGKFEGKGSFYYKNGEIYSGEWANNAHNGSGKLVAANGKITQGEWANGVLMEQAASANSKPNANSKPTAANSEANLQNCNSSYCKEGRGVFTYADGTRWEGEFKDGIPEGAGTCYYADGTKYVGRFEKHAPHGEGIMYYKDGRLTAAIWEYGRPIGELPSNSKVDQTAVKIDESPEVKIWAVVVGVGRYTTMPVLKYSKDDAYQYYAFLKSPEGGALPDNQVKILVDEDATRVNILQTMRQTLLQADANDVIIFYFSGHGLDGAFLPQEFDGVANKLYHHEIKEILDQSHAKHKICIADACNSGSLMAMKGANYDQTLKNYYKAFDDTKGGLALFMSSKREEYSLEDQGMRSGIFSHYLIRGLKGDADVDGDKVVTMRELYDFVYKNVRTYTSNAQTPSISGSFDWRMPVASVR